MAQKTFDICTECGKKTEVVIVDEVTRLCDKCLDLLDYIECDRCHEYWQYDSVEFFESEDGENICEYCYEDED